MKKQLLLLAAMLMIFATVAQAQELTEPAIKILPTTDPGIIKVLYANKLEKNVVVKFFNDDALLLSDAIRAKDCANGFLKRYDVRNIAAKDFHIEVSSDAMRVVYKMTDSPSGMGLVPVLENATYYYPTVAAKN